MSMCVSAINVTHFRPLMGLLNRDGHRLHNDPKRSARGTGAKKKKIQARMEARRQTRAGEGADIRSDRHRRRNKAEIREQ